VELLVTSAVPRAIETAAILATGTGLVPVVNAGWNELRPGDLALLPPARLRAVIMDAYRNAADPGACFFGGEGFGDFARRVGDVLGTGANQQGSPAARRNADRARLAAGWLMPRRSAVRVTLRV